MYAPNVRHDRDIVFFCKIKELIDNKAQRMKLYCDTKNKVSQSL